MQIPLAVVPEVNWASVPSDVVSPNPDDSIRHIFATFSLRAGSCSEGRSQTSTPFGSKKLGGPRDSLEIGDDDEKEKT